MPSGYSSNSKHKRQKSGAGGSGAVVIPEVSAASAAFLFEDDDEVVDENNTSQQQQSVEINNIHLSPPTHSLNQRPASHHNRTSSAHKRTPSQFSNHSHSKHHGHSNTSLADDLETDQRQIETSKRETLLLDEILQLNDTVGALGNTLAESEKERTALTNQLNEAIEQMQYATTRTTPQQPELAGAANSLTEPPSTEHLPLDSREQEGAGQKGAGAHSSSASSHAAGYRIPPEVEEELEFLRRQNHQLLEDVGALHHEIDDLHEQLQNAHNSNPPQQPSLHQEAMLDENAHDRHDSQSPPNAGVSPEHSHPSGLKERRGSFGARSNQSNSEVAPSTQLALEDEEGGAISTTHYSKLVEELKTLRVEYQRLKVEHEKRSTFHQAHVEKLWGMVKMRTKQLHHVSTLLAATRSFNANNLKEMLDEFGGTASSILDPDLAQPSQVNGYKHYRRHNSQQPLKAEGGIGGANNGGGAFREPQLHANQRVMARAANGVYRGYDQPTAAWASHLRRNSQQQAASPMRRHSHAGGFGLASTTGNLPATRQTLQKTKSSLPRWN